MSVTEAPIQARAGDADRAGVHADQPSNAEYTSADKLIDHIGPDSELTLEPNPEAVAKSDALRQGLVAYKDKKKEAETELAWSAVAPIGSDDGEIHKRSDSSQITESEGIATADALSNEADTMLNEHLNAAQTQALVVQALAQEIHETNHAIDIDPEPSDADKAVDSQPPTPKA